MYRYLLFFAAGLALIGCDKSEGTGGTSSISGKVFSINFKDENALNPDTTLALEEDVYIRYGNDSEIADKCVTDENGEYHFEYLRPGDYTIITYAKVEESDRDTAIIRKIEIKDKKSDVRVEDIYINKIKTGFATINGRIFVNDYNATMKPKNPVDTFYAGGEDVYLQRVGATDIFDKEVTSYDGKFMFRHVPIGKYIVYAYTKDTIEMSGSNGNDFSTRPIPEVMECEIEKPGQKLVLERLTIIK